MKSFEPRSRRLRVYSFDPSLATDIATWGINQIVIDVPWEKDREGVSTLSRGPVGEYIEVIDFDPASGAFYKPVDLNDARLLSQDGLPASESNPQFHQQMVYAVAMATIDHFEKAFGRKIFWAPHVIRNGAEYVEQYVKRLRIYPHALRQRNAYYSPRRKALLFGYFPITSKDTRNTPGAIVHTCLSHDVIVHEMSHALLDGIHPRFNEPTNPDVHAFHEAFADIVAIFQRFSYPGVLESQIAATRGDFARENMLAKLAQQFGRATGRHSALRDALGATDPKTGEWRMREPDPRALEGTYAPHDRGAILVAAVFRAFTLVYHHRVADLIRLASSGTGVLPDGAIHPDLVRRLASEARDIASRIVRMCIRALDYVPPTDITFGDYLRAVVTADLDLNPEDEDDCRVAFVQSFREWGIAPAGIRSMSVAALVLPKFAEADALSSGQAATRQLFVKAREDYRMHSAAWKGALSSVHEDAEVLSATEGRRLSARGRPIRIKPIRVDAPRFDIWSAMDDSSLSIWLWLNKSADPVVTRTLGLVIDPQVPPTVYRNESGIPAVEVHAVRPITRRAHRLAAKVDLVVEVTQRRRGYFAKEEQKRHDSPNAGPPEPSERGDFTFRAGCTFFLDPETYDIEWVIKTPGNVASNEELDRMRLYLTGKSYPKSNAFDSGLPVSLAAASGRSRDEPFALLHHDAES